MNADKKMYWMYKGVNVFANIVLFLIIAVILILFLAVVFGITLLVMWLTG